ncbi:MAG: hypothetical protein HOK75_05610 [Phycisphaerae bacterium]|jgi:hypothetical protein|nr:hypothetical protein [Phycisphaerae bacterium]MBT5409723.1 hypothetical protein [Phycisphaerae bacterium]|tara:strand:+ start:4975 stop:5829 length:855 start_codon:yes stop_codon:yes gene_type:complete
MKWINTYILLLCLTASSAFAGSTKRYEFEWKDINTREVVRWEGDTAIVNPRSSITELDCSIKINNRDIDAAIESFGIPKSWTTFTYTSEDDLQKKQVSLQKKAARRGIKMSDDMKSYVIDYQWVIDQSSRELRDAAKDIRSIARRKGYRSRRELVGAFASFVQSLEYRLPPNNRIDDNGKEIITIGAIMPIEVLTNQWGDCDSKSMLFATLVRSIDLTEVVFIVKHEHVFAAVDVIPEPEDQTIRYKGDDWVLIELTDAWPIGRVPEEHIECIDQKQFEIVGLH